MATQRARSFAVVGGAAAFCFLGASAHACQVPMPPVGSILHGSGSGNCDPCAPTDCGTPFAPDSGGSTFGSTGRGGIPFDVSMIDNAFVPASPIIKPNTSVRWTNNGFFVHTSTRFGRWNSGFLDSGQTFDHPFGEADAGKEFAYVCILHFGMDGTIRVARFGDANLDGVVNLADFNILASNFGTSGQSWETGDFTGDGVVNLADFNLLAANFGMGITPALSTINLGFDSSVPEPGMVSMLTPLMLMTRRKRPT